MNPNDKYDSNEMPIFGVATVAVLRCLVTELGANPRACNSEGKSILDNLISSGIKWGHNSLYTTERVGMIRFLVKECNLEWSVNEGAPSWFRLVQDGVYADVQLLIELDVDFSAKDELGETALFYASEPSILELLLTEANIDPDVECNNGKTAEEVDRISLQTAIEELNLLVGENKAEVLMQGQCDDDAANLMEELTQDPEFDTEQIEQLLSAIEHHQEKVNIYESTPIRERKFARAKRKEIRDALRCDSINGETPPDRFLLDVLADLVCAYAKC